MPNFAGEMHHHEMRHLSSTSGQRTRSGAHHVFCCWLKASWRCTPSPGTVSVSCRISKWPDQLVGLSKGYSIGFGAGHVISRQWAGELPSFCPSAKGEHRRHIVTTGQNLSVATSTFSLHLQLECSTKSLSTS